MIVSSVNNQWKETGFSAGGKTREKPLETGSKTAERPVEPGEKSPRRSEAMPDFARSIKEEISRLAKKEVRKAAAPLHARIRSLVKTVSGQEKKIARLEKVATRQEKVLLKSAPVPEAARPEEVKKARISPRLVKTQRKRLKLNQADFARLLSVSVAAVRSWEQGRALPKEGTMATFVAVRKLKPKEAWDRLGIAGPKRKPHRTKRARRKKKG
jgi:DNA-binding transcriptional regulator YiaG